MRLNTRWKYKDGRNPIDESALKILQGATPITTSSSDSGQFDWVISWSACFDENIVFYVPMNQIQAKYSFSQQEIKTDRI